MRSLYLRIYLTVLVALALFALVSGWLVQRHFEQERERIVASFQERAAAWGELLQGSLPGADAPPQQQAEALSDWSQRLRLPLALDDAQGVRIGASDSYLRREAEGGPRPRHAQQVPLQDGRTLWMLRPPLRGPPAISGAMRIGGEGRLRPGAGPALGGQHLLNVADAAIVRFALPGCRHPVLHDLLDGVDDVEEADPPLVEGLTHSSFAALKTAGWVPPARPTR